MATSPLLTLPRELRELIYEFYLRCDGYTYEYNSGKLHTTDLDKIDLSLMYTCNQIATEMQGLPLQTNKVFFFTIYHENLRWDAGQFGALLRQLHELRRWLLDRSQHFITSEMMSEIEIRYPQLLPILDRIKTRGSCESLTDQTCGFPPSVHYDFVTECLRFLSKDPKFGPHVFQNGAGSAGLVALSLHKDPWLIPTENDIAIMNQIKMEGFDNMEFYGPTKYRLSAACGAINFLQKLTKYTRSQLRQIVLREERMAVAYPESHARGLIPFCIENPHLRVERYVTLWTNVFPAINSSPYLMSTLDWQHREERRMNAMNTNVLSKAIVLWAGEALALSSLGMPGNSFSLIFDGDPISDRSSQAFEIIRRDAVWQVAFEESHKRNYLPREPIQWYYSRLDTTAWFQMHLSRPFVSDIFPQILLDIKNGKSIISCNFPIGSPWEENEVEDLIDAHKEWSSEQWDKEFFNHNPKGLDTEPPLLPWVEMLLGELDQESEGVTP